MVREVPAEFRALLRYNKLPAIEAHATAFEAILNVFDVHAFAIWPNCLRGMPIGRHVEYTEKNRAINYAIVGSFRRWRWDLFPSKLKRSPNLPRLLLRLGRQGEVLDGRRVDLLGAEGVADARQQIAEREDALHLQFGQRESRGNVLNAAAFLDQPGVAFPLRHLIGILPQHVLDHRNFERLGIVALAQGDAGQRHAVLALPRGLKTGKVAALARDDLEMTGVAVGPDEQRRNHAALDDRRQDVRNVGRLLAAAHIGLGNRKVVQRDLVDVHGIYSVGWPHPRGILGGGEDGAGFPRGTIPRGVCRNLGGQGGGRAESSWARAADAASSRASSSVMLPIDRAASA